MPDVVSVVADGDDAHRAPQGVILAVLNQFSKAFGTNYFLRVSTTKRHLFDTFSDTFAFYLIHFLKFFAAFYRVYLRRSFVVEVWRATLWSGARSWGPGGITPIQRLLFRSGREHCDLELAVVVAVVVVVTFFGGLNHHYTNMFGAKSPRRMLDRSPMDRK